MKNRLYLPLLVLLLCMLVHRAQAQGNCTDYLLLNNNTRYELLTYNSQDELMNRVTYQVKSVDTNGSKVEAVVQSRVYDNQGILGSEGEFTVGCESGSLWMDMRSMVSPETMDAYKDMEVRMHGDQMLYPDKLKAGQKLEDALLTIETKDKASGQRLNTVTLKITNRMVEGEEAIQVPAGSYRSYKISQNTQLEDDAAGVRMPGMRVQNVEYYVPRIGVVRSESYHNGRLMSYSVLNKIGR